MVITWVFVVAMTVSTIYKCYLSQTKKENVSKHYIHDIRSYSLGILLLSESGLISFEYYIPSFHVDRCIHNSHVVADDLYAHYVCQCFLDLNVQNGVSSFCMVYKA